MAELILVTVCILGTVPQSCATARFREPEFYMSKEACAEAGYRLARAIAVRRLEAKIGDEFRSIATCRMVSGA